MATTSDEVTADRDAQPQVDLPGLGQLRAIVANYLHARLPRRSTLRTDAVAGLSLAVANVPDGMANGFLVGVNPIYGLYATMAGPIVGGLLSSTQLMVITTTAAASITASQALAGLPEERRTTALFVMVVLAGVSQLLFGALGLGRLTRFVSFSVTTGFLTGVSVLLIMSQLPTIAGMETNGSNRVAQTVDLLAHVCQVDLATLTMAVIALVLAIMLPRTKLGAVGRLVAIVVPSAIVAVARLSSVRIVSHVGDMPGGMPIPSLPSLSDFAPGVITGALSVAIVALVQGVGVSQNVPNADGTPTSVRRDMTAQGAANVASGFFHGLPVGGSLSATALGVIGGARSRWAAVSAGAWMAVLVLGVPDLVSYVAMPALGALLLLAGAGSIRLGALRAVWYTGWPSRLAASTTFLGTLFLPIQAAVGIGVVLAALLYVNESAADISIVQLVIRPDGRIEEREPERRLCGNGVTVLDVYGHLFYAGARTLEQRLPRPGDAKNPVVILRLRGRTTPGATLLDVLTHYADELQSAGGRLYLSGIGRHAHEQLVHAGKLQRSGPIRLFDATPIVGDSTRAALADAEAWLADRQEGA
ncbi:MAG TPA: SulP family inorganic anion transporter [Gemmatimonadaceae bacterium]|nr:SulP family inorganic anion transporter [Gemmatimonadaceae bacterium]